ncbi:MAG: DedA family protein [Thermoplasmatota archaeon]
MGLLSDALAAVATFAVDLISRAGYAGLFVAMVAESMVFPVPSEAVLPFAGYLAATGRFSLGLVVAVAIAGSLVGSLVSYALGAWGLEPALERWGKYVLVKREHLAASHAWFERRGALAVFLSRFIPAVRHVVSLPAGTARMPLGPFVVATALGAGAWDAILVVAGYEFGARWSEVEPYARGAGLVALALAGALALVLGTRWWISRRRPAPSRRDSP